MACHFLLLAITTILITLLFLSPPTAGGSPVLDVEGNPLEVGSQYYVLTAGRGAAGRGGLTHVAKPPHLCPTYVAQHYSWFENGSPVFFHPTNSSQKQITVGDDVSINFGYIPLCRGNGVWKVTFDNQTNVPYIVAANRGGGYNELETFKIEETAGGFSYKIVFCMKQAAAARNDDDNISRSRECKQVDATERGPLDLSYLSLAPLDQGLPFFGFIFSKKKVDPSTSTAAAAAFY